MAKFAQETRGNNRWANPTAFFQTPLHVANCMAQMLFHGEEDITKSVIDPCAGTGTLLLVASNYSVNLYGAEISWELCLMLELNGYLYIPWLIKPAPWLQKSMEYPVKEREEKPVEEEFTKSLQVEGKQVEFRADKKGQLLLFDFGE